MAGGDLVGCFLENAHRDWWPAQLLHTRRAIGHLCVEGAECWRTQISIVVAKDNGTCLGADSSWRIQIPLSLSFT